MTKNEYNGWFNYETWVVNLWMDNEQGSQEFWREQADYALRHAARSYESQTQEQAATCQLADTLKAQHEETLPELTGFAADLLSAAMSEVNWYEIAEHLITEVQVDK